MTKTTVGHRAILTAYIIVVLALFAMPDSVWAHAQLTGTSPSRGETVPTAPELIELEFNEPVEASFGALRLYDSTGQAIDTGPVERPEGRQEAVAIQPPSDLPEGAYTVTFRVVSADSHPVSGGFIFTIGAQEAPALTVAELLEGQGSSGPVTDVVFAGSRVLSYAALAGMLGSLAFLLLVWRSRRQEVESDALFFGIARKLMIVGGSALAFSAAAGIVFQGALAGGIAIPQALDTDVIGEVLETRYGETALVRGAAGVLFVALALFAWRSSRPGRGLLVALALLGVVGSASLGLGGHAGAASPAWLTASASLGHVIAMAAWFGGLGILLWVVPRITRRLPVGRRTALLADLVGRFSIVGIAAVAILLISGLVQSVVHLGEVAELWQSSFGLMILIKAIFFSGLIALGWHNRQRLRPRLAAAAAEGSSPGSAGKALRTALRAEVGLALGVLIASSVLVSLAPASSMDAIFTDTDTAGPIQVEIVFEPPRIGTQEVHIYLFDGATGRQWDEIEEIGLSATESDQDIGPLPIELRRAGPGHYLNGGDLIAVPGRWRLDLDIRVSEFDLYSTDFELRIR